MNLLEKHASVFMAPVLWPTGESSIGDKDDVNSMFMEMICPAGTNPDDSPLYVLCCNDTCSFTWTGAEHINQVNATRLTLHRWEINEVYIQKKILLTSIQKWFENVHMNTPSHVQDLNG